MRRQADEENYDYLPGNMTDTGPYSETAEMSVIGGCLLWKSGVELAAKCLQIDHFWSPNHKAMFRAILKIHNAGYQPDLMSVTSQLVDDGWDRSTAEDLSMSLAEFVVGRDGYDRHVAEVQEKWALREFGKLGQESLLGSVDYPEALKRVKQISDGAIQGAAATGLIGDYVGSRAKRGLPSRFNLINRNTVTRGWPEGQVAVICAYTGVGKSWLLIQDAVYCARYQGPVALATFADLSAEDIADRMVKQICGWSNEPPSGHPAWGAWIDACEEVKGLPIYIYDATQMRAGRDIESVTAWAANLDEKVGLKAQYVDYAQIIETRQKTRSDLETLKAVTYACQWFAAETKIPLIIASQMTEGNSKFGTQDITKGGRVLEEGAGIVIRVKKFDDDERQKLDPPFCNRPGVTLMHLWKNRFGDGGLKQFDQWNKDFGRFDEIFTGEAPPENDYR